MNLQEMIDSAKRRFQDDEDKEMDKELTDSAQRYPGDDEDYRDSYYGDEY